MPATSASGRPGPAAGGSAFWPALWMAVVMAGAKAAHWSLPEATAKRLHEYGRDLAVSAHADVLFAVLVGLATQALLWLVGERPRVLRLFRLLYLAFCLACVVYALASVQIFAYLRSPLTYALLYIGGDMGTLGSSLGRFLSARVVLVFLGVPVLYLVGVRICEQRLPLARDPLGRVAQVLALGTLLCLIEIAHETALGPWRDRDDRRIAQNPHWVLASSYAREILASGAGEDLGLTFPPEYLREFETQPAAKPAQRAALGGFGPPRNLILLVLESVGTRYLSLYGSPYATTPELQREAQNALVFENFYCHVGMTANAMAAITLSLWPYMTWREYTQEYPDLPGTTLAQLFKARGHRTAFVHNGHLEYVNQHAFLESRGFDVLWDFADLGGGEEPLSSWGGGDHLAIDGILKFIDQEPKQPFYVHSWTSATHHPYEPGSRLELVDFFLNRPLPPDDYDLGRYLNLVRELDRQIGRLFDGLRERGLDQDTLVAITGDHGEAFGEPHPTWGHGARVYRENVNVPFLIWSPRLFPRGRRFKTLGSHVDVIPTLAELAALPAPEAWHGRSLFDKARSPRVYFYAANDDYLLGVREGDRKYIYNATTGREELYELSTDPAELNDLARQLPAECRRLRGHVAAWRDYVFRDLVRLKELRERRKAPLGPRRAAARPL